MICPPEGGHGPHRCGKAVWGYPASHCGQGDRAGGGDIRRGEPEDRAETALTTNRNLRRADFNSACRRRRGHSEPLARFATAFRTAQRSQRSPRP